MGSNRVTLIVVAHPDDNIFGCGGLILKRLAADEEVGLVCFSSPMDSPEEYFNRSEKFQKELAALNYTFTYNFGLPALRLSMIDSYKAMTDRLYHVFDEVKPTSIITHHMFDLHQDHQYISQLCRIVGRCSRDNSLREYMEFEIPNTETIQTFEFDTVVDISDHIEHLTELTEIHSRDFSPEHPHHTENIMAFKRVNGIKYQCRAVERFKTIYRIE